MELELSGREVILDKKSAVLLSEGELTEKPFVHAPESLVVRGSEGKNSKTNKEIEYFGLKKDSVDAVKSEVTKGQTETKKHSSEGLHTGSSSKRKDGGNKDSSKDVDRPPASNWIRPGIRVKIVSKKVDRDSAVSSAKSGSVFYLQKGVVLDVPTRGVASLRLDDGKLLSSVAEKHLETVLPTVGGICMILAGEYKSETAVLIEKDSESDRAMVQLSESLDMIMVGLDDVAAFVAQ